MKNVKEMMFDITYDDDSDKDQTSTHKIQVKPNNQNYNRERNKYESTPLSRGLFSQTEEDFQYNICPNKKQEPSKQPPIQDIRISHRSSHLLHEIQFQSSSQSEKEQGEASQNENKEIIDKSNTQIEKEFIIAPLSSKQLLNIVFDQSDEEEDTSIKEDNNKKKKEDLLNLTYNDISNLEIFPNQNTNKRQFVKSQMKKGTTAKFTISRNQSGLNFLWPEFMLLFNENGKPFVHAKKMMGNSTGNYYITSQKGVENVYSDNFIGKLRSNFTGSVLNILSPGLNPKKVVNGQIPRYIQATIKYNGQVMAKKPRQFQVYIIKDQYKYMDLQGTIKGEQIGLDILYNYKKENQNKLWFFKNRKPVYSEQTKGFILNFGGRVQKPSVKNYILEDPKDCREVMMLGKTDEDIFRMQVSYPLKPYIAFGISLANFDSKYVGE